MIVIISKPQGLVSGLLSMLEKHLVYDLKIFVIFSNKLFYHVRICYVLHADFNHMVDRRESRYLKICYVDGYMILISFLL